MSTRTHGMHGTSTHRVWANMIQRCTNPRHPGYADYGGRGIAVCARWRSFEAFYADMGDRPPNKSLDRIDNDGGYAPGNCRWVSMRVQHRNRRSNRIVTFRGQALCLTEWAERFGLHRFTLQGRLKRGWSVEKALTTPVRRGR